MATKLLVHVDIIQVILLKRAENARSSYLPSYVIPSIIYVLGIFTNNTKITSYLLSAYTYLYASIFYTLSCYNHVIKQKLGNSVSYTHLDVYKRQSPLYTHSHGQHCIILTLAINCIRMTHFKFV